jgi:hypothetical protein
VTLAVPPTNQAEALGPEHNVPPAQLPALLCQISGVVPWAVITKESLDTGKRSALKGNVLLLRFSNRWYWVLREEIEICEDKPLRVGGQTTTG